MEVKGKVYCKDCVYMEELGRNSCYFNTLEGYACWYDCEDTTNPIGLVTPRSCLEVNKDFNCKNKAILVKKWFGMFK